jgi:hypothetical protein
MATTTDDTTGTTAPAAGEAFSNLRGMELSDDGNDLMLQELDAMEPGDTTADSEEGASDASTEPSSDAGPEGEAPEPTEATAKAESQPAASTAEEGAEPEPDVPPEIAAILKEAIPLRYTVDGLERTFDAITEVKGQGAIIPSEQLERVRNTLAYAEKSISDNQKLYQRVQAFEKMGGSAEIEKLRREKAAVDAAGTRLLHTLQQAFPGEDNAELLQSILREAALDARDAEWRVRDELSAGQQTEQQGAFRESQRENTFNDAFRQMRAALPQLTDSDMRAAYTHFSQFKGALFRNPTPAEQQTYGWSPDQDILDVPKMHDWFTERAGWRSAQAQEASARRSAEAENKKRLATTAAPVSRPPARKNASNNKPKEEKKLTASEIRRTWARGEFITEDE